MDTFSSSQPLSSYHRNIRRRIWPTYVPGRLGNHLTCCCKMMNIEAKGTEWGTIISCTSCQQYRRRRCSFCQLFKYLHILCRCRGFKERGQQCRICPLFLSLSVFRLCWDFRGLEWSTCFSNAHYPTRLEVCIALKMQVDCHTGLAVAWPSLRSSTILHYDRSTGEGLQ